MPSEVAAAVCPSSLLTSVSSPSKRSVLSSSLLVSYQVSCFRFFLCVLGDSMTRSSSYTTINLFFTVDVVGFFSTREELLVLPAVVSSACADASIDSHPFSLLFLPRHVVLGSRYPALAR